MKFIHQETNRATVHPVNRDIKPLGRVQRLQHETITAKRHDDVCLGLQHIAISCGQFAQSSLRNRHRAGNKSDLGARHRAKTFQFLQVVG